VPVQLQWQPSITNDEAQVGPVEFSVERMDSAVHVWGEDNHVVLAVRAASRQPMNVVGLGNVPG
jgi:hypothetical protein